MAVAHGVGQDVAQRRRHQVVERARVLRQGQVEQPLAQGVRERLPNRARRQRGEVVGDAVYERVRRTAERLLLAFAHVASIGLRRLELPWGARLPVWAQWNEPRTFRM